ncbi:hypothetical protein BC827DRAFT_1285227 [Russula dissimulans]|nr:hypothetical protein BC827DRAFT_1285227 [Russula dissimulans]
MNWHSGMVKCSKLRVEEADRRTKGLEASQDHVRKKRREKRAYKHLQTSEQMIYGNMKMCGIAFWGDMRICYHKRGKKWVHKKGNVKNGAQVGLSNKDSCWEFWGMARLGQATGDLGRVGGPMGLQVMNGIWVHGQFRGREEESETRKWEDSPYCPTGCRLSFKLGVLHRPWFDLLLHSQKTYGCMLCLLIVTFVLLLVFTIGLLDQERLEKKRNRRTKGVDTVQTQAGVSKRRSTWIQVDLDEKWGNMCTVSLGRVTIGVS